MILTWSNFIAHRIDFTRTACCSPSSENETENVINSFSLSYAGENGWTITSHQLRIPVHDFKGSTNMRCKVDLMQLSKRGPWFAMPYAHFVDDE